MRIQQYLRQFWQAEDAQDLIEYTLIVAFVALTVLGILSIFSPKVTLIWRNNNTILSAAQSTATAH